MEAKRPLMKGLVWKKSENYQKCYLLMPFEAPDEWLDQEFRYGVDETYFETE